MTAPRVPADWLPRYIALSQPHYLYRCYDAGGRLLYLGCSADPSRRLTTHRASRKSTSSALLQRFMDRHEVAADVYAGRVAGQRAESDAIRAEQPVLNQKDTGVPLWMRNRQIARYIHEQTGRWPATHYDRDGFETGLYCIDAASLSTFFARAVA